MQFRVYSEHALLPNLFEIKNIHKLRNFTFVFPELVMTKRCLSGKLSPWWLLILMWLLMKAPKIDFQRGAILERLLRNLATIFMGYKATCVRERWSLAPFFLKYALHTLNRSQSLVAYWKRKLKLWNPNILVKLEHASIS